jgi:hypothetical protein
VGVQVLRAKSIKMAVIWDVALCNPIYIYILADVSEDVTASNIRAILEPESCICTERLQMN